MDYSALPLRLVSYVGVSDSPLDITPYFNGFQSQPKGRGLDAEGYESCTCSILLVNDASPSGLDLETRFNARWGIASKIELSVRNAANTDWILHRTFRILDNFYDDGIQEGQKGIASLELELGDLFALKDKRYPHPGDIDIPIIVPTIDVPVWQTVNWWLRVFNLPEITFLPGDEQPQDRIYGTATFEGGSSAVEHCARILYDNSGFILWIDAQERVRVRRAGLPPTTINYTWPGSPTNWFPTIAARTAWHASFTDTLAQMLPASAISFAESTPTLLINKRSQSEREKPAGFVQVFGVGNYRYPYVDPPSSTTTSNTANGTTTETITVSTTATTRTVTKTGTQQITGLQSGTANSADPGNLGSYEEITVETYGGGFPEIPNANPVLPPWPGIDNYLLSKVVTIREQRPTTGSTLGAIATTKTVETTYRYRNTSAWVKGLYVRGVEIEEIIETTKILPKSTSTSGSGGSGGATLQTDQVKTQRWVYLAKDLYLYTESIVFPGEGVNRRYGSETSNVGESTPPGTNWAPQTRVVDQRELYAEARFEYPPDAPDNDHPMTIDLGLYCDNNRAMRLRALQEGAIRIGRHEAQDLAFRPTDTWLADPIPLPWVVVPYNNVDDDLYLLDTTVMSFEERRSYLGGKGTWYGRRNRVTGVITPPWSIPYRAVGFTANVAVGFNGVAVGFAI